MDPELRGGQAGPAPVHGVVLKRREIEPELQVLRPLTGRDVELPRPPRRHLPAITAATQWFRIAVREGVG